MGLMFFGLYMGPLAGPNIGGGLTYYWSWRATFWFCFIYAATACVGMILFTVETYRPTDFSPPTLTSSSSSSHLKMSNSIEMEDVGERDALAISSVGDRAHPPNDNNDKNEEYSKIEIDDRAKSESTPTAEDPPPTPISKPFNPIQSLLFLRYNFVYFTALSTGVAFGVMFMLETILPELFQQTYNLNSWQV
jgi:MFS family permease